MIGDGRVGLVSSPPADGLGNEQAQRAAHNQTLDSGKEFVTWKFHQMKTDMRSAKASSSLREIIQLIKMFFSLKSLC